MATQSLSRTKGLITVVTSEPIILLDLFPWMSWPDDYLVPHLNQIQQARLLTFPILGHFAKDSQELISLRALNCLTINIIFNDCSVQCGFKPK